MSDESEWQPGVILPSQEHIDRGMWSDTKPEDVRGKIVRVRRTNHIHPCCPGRQVVAVHPEDAQKYGTSLWTLCESEVLTD